MASAGSDDIDIFGFHQDGGMVAVSAFHMRGGRVVNKKEMFWEDQEQFNGPAFFEALLKQYYLDAPFIPVEIHVPESFEDQALLSERLSALKGRKVEVRTPRRGGKREMMELVRRNAKLVFDQRFRSATLPRSAIAPGPRRSTRLGKDAKANRGVRYLQPPGYRHRGFDGRLAGGGDGEIGLSPFHNPLRVRSARRFQEHARSSAPAVFSRGGSRATDA